jgi:adenine phosphoribosyltransferase
MPEILVIAERKKIDKVIGVESRGFSSLIAQELNVGFVPVRKPNKLPYDTISASYELEYGTDTLEIHTDAIPRRGYLFMMMSSQLEEPKQYANWWRNWAVKSSS